MSPTRRARLSVQPLEPRDCPAGPDLRAEVLRVKLPDIAVPGDPGLVTFRISNIGDAPAAGTTGFHLYMSADTTKDGSDWLFGKVRNKTLNLAPPKPGAMVGGSVTYTALVEIPELVLPNPVLPEGSYYILAEADSGTQIGENDESNNVAASEATFDYKF